MNHNKQWAPLQEGDLIDVSPDGCVAIFRGKALLEFVVDPLFTSYFLHVRVEPGQEILHEYAWWIARALASIAGLYVVDDYALSDQGHHQFPVTRCAPAEPPPAA